MDKERNARVIVYYNNKGGVGKTTLAVNHAIWRAMVCSERVLIMDFDCQCNTSYNFLGFSKEELVSSPDTRTIANIPGFPGKGIPKINPVKLVCKAPNYNLYAIKGCSDIDTLWESDPEVSGKLDLVMGCVDSLRSKFDTIIIDLGPRKTKATLAALCAADYVILPMTLNPMAESGIDDFFEEMLPVCQQYNPAITPLGVVITMFRTVGMSLINYAQMTPRIMEKHPDAAIYKTKIRDSSGIGNMLSTSMMAKAGLKRPLTVIDKYIRQNYPAAYEDFEKFMLETDEKILAIEEQ